MIYILADVSGSMSYPENKPISACISLALMIAPLCCYKNTVLTFQSTPEFHHIEGDSLYERMRNLQSANWGGSTNIQDAFKLILDGVRQGLISRYSWKIKVYLVS